MIRGTALAVIYSAVLFTAGLDPVRPQGHHQLTPGG